MLLVYHYIFLFVWAAFLIYWQIMWQRMAAGAKANQRLESAASRVLRAVLICLAILLMGYPRIPVAWLSLQLWPQGLVSFWAGFAVTLAGLLFCVWARVHLGRNWSSAVTVKQDHELIVSGPYALVRHPIYSGLLLAFAGTALAIGQIRALLGFALVAIAPGLKLRLEEKWMRTQFGAKYEAYSERVKALVPGLL